MQFILRGGVCEVCLLFSKPSPYARPEPSALDALIDLLNASIDPSQPAMDVDEALHSRRVHPAVRELLQRCPGISRLEDPLAEVWRPQVPALLADGMPAVLRACSCDVDFAVLRARAWMLWMADHRPMTAVRIHLAPDGAPTSIRVALRGTRRWDEAYATLLERATSGRAVRLDVE